MFLSDTSVKRPVFASVLSILLIVFGLVAFSRLPLREFPDIDVSLRGAVSLARETDPEARSTRAIRYFAFSITHLTVLFSAMAVDELVGWGVG